MSDIGSVFPPGGLVWLAALALSSICGIAIVIFLATAWLRSRKTARNFTHDRFFGYATGAAASALIAGGTMWMINHQPAFGRWLDHDLTGALYVAMLIAILPIAGYLWNRRSHP